MLCIQFERKTKTGCLKEETSLENCNSCFNVLLYRYCDSHSFFLLAVLIMDTAGYVVLYRQLLSVFMKAVFSDFKLQWFVC